jgi:hypothetical protein
MDSAIHGYGFTKQPIPTATIIRIRVFYLTANRNILKTQTNGTAIALSQAASDAQAAVN